MTEPILKKGDKGDGVSRLQSCLNRVGAMLTVDGDFGLATESGVRYARKLAKINETGIADSRLWAWLEKQPEPFPRLDTDGVAFIALEETGGLAYYDTHARWPHYPGGKSGITIGVGYDLRFNSRKDFLTSWVDSLSNSAITELVKDIGKEGTKKRVRKLRRKGVHVPFKSAWSVFIKKTLPRYFADTKSIYPTLELLPGLCRSVLVSIVFNRGNSLKGDGRKEMRAIQTILDKAAQDGLDRPQIKLVLVEVEEQIVSMKRLWKPTSGVFKRRQAEANLWRRGLEQW